MKDFINKINNKEDLTLNEMQEAINLIMSGMSDDCLLYTSPSPRDLVLSRMPSSA